MTALTVNDVRRTPATRNIIESIIIGVVLTALSYIVGAEAHWTLTQGWQLWLEIFAVFTSYSCTYLCVRERRIQYPIGAISTLAYAWLFYEFGLNGSALLNLWLTVQLAYGWFRWRSDDDARPVTLVALKWWPAYIVSTVAFYLVGYWLDVSSGGTQVWTDIVIVTGSILAQWLLDNKKLENWVVWLVVDVFATYEYFTAGLTIVGFQYIFFTLNVFYGFYVWYRSRQASNKPKIKFIEESWQDDGIITHQYVSGGTKAQAAYYPCTGPDCVACGLHTAPEPARV